jgi:hypothetical protein
VKQARQQAYLELLERGLVAIRNHAHGGETALCAIEADHIHNLPSLFKETNEARHRFYIIQVRSLYLDRLKQLGAADYLQDRAIWYRGPWKALASIAGVELSGPGCVTTSEDLIGVWSADARFGPGAQSDEMLIFKPDGTGRMDFLNWQLCSSDFFRWQIVSWGVLDLIGYRCLELGDDGESVVEAESTFRHAGVPFGVAEEDTPSGKRMLVLRIGLPRPWPSELGLVRRELGPWAEPRFKGEG